MKQVNVLYMEDSDVTNEMATEMCDLWSDQCFGNDDYYYSWERNYDGELWKHESNYSNLNKYLMDSGVEKCLIHYCW